MRRIELALAELEAEEYRRIVVNLFPNENWYKSIPVEEVSKRTGISPRRIVELVYKYRRRTGIKRIKCVTSSKVGWCIKHEDYVYGVSLADPKLAEMGKELLSIRSHLSRCMAGSVLIKLEEKLFRHRLTRCGLREEDIVRLITRAAVIAEELGISQEKMREWLELGEDKTEFELDDGRIFVVESAKMLRS